MSKIDLINELHNRTGILKVACAEILDALAECAKAAVGSGTELSIPGVGKITTRQKAARTGRNPATGTPVEIPAKTVVAFKAAKALTDAAN